MKSIQLHTESAGQRFKRDVLSPSKAILALQGKPFSEDKSGHSHQETSFVG
jgi:hypothetical protein